jgi:hypothetical protein
MTQRDEDDGPDLEQASRADRTAGRSVWEEAVIQEEQDGRGSPADTVSAGGPAETDGRAGTGSPGGPPGYGPGRRPGESPSRSASRPGGDRRQSRPRPSRPGPDVLSDFQRWLLRSSAKSMGREISGQVRKSLGGGRQGRADVWDTATTEIPPEVGESPECQWCPICRAARRMRDSSPELGDQLSAAGDVVASAVHEAMRAFDSVITRTTGSEASRAGRGVHRTAWSTTQDGRSPESADLGDWVAARDAWAAEHGAEIVDRPDGPASSGQPQQDEPTSEPDGPDEPDDRG